jgi:hypothetical protein
MRGVCVLALCALMLGLAGCGGGGQLSKAEYKAALAKILKKADAAEHVIIETDVSNPPPVSDLVSKFRTLSEKDDGFGDEIEALKAPSDAADANALLAKSAHDDAAAIRKLLPKFSTFDSSFDLIDYLKTQPAPKSAKEREDALSTLEELGYYSP